VYPAGVSGVCAPIADVDRAGGRIERQRLDDVVDKCACVACDVWTEFNGLDQRAGVEIVDTERVIVVYIANPDAEHESGRDVDGDRLFVAGACCVGGMLLRLPPRLACTCAHAKTGKACLAPTQCKGEFETRPDKARDMLIAQERLLTAEADVNAHSS
jgi:hypothetical protein